VKDLRSGKEKPFVFPKKIEGCGGDGSVERIAGQAAYRCVHRGSFAEKRRKFHHFVSKKVFNIDGLGPNIIDLLLEEGMINTYDDIFTLAEGDIVELPGFKEKSAKNLIDAINKSKIVTLPRFLMGLSIDQVGEETAHDLADHLGSLKSVQDATYEKLDQIEGVGEIVARSICDWFADGNNKALVGRLLNHVVIESLEKKRGKLLGKTFVITGTLSSFSRDRAKDAVRLSGGNVSSSVSKSTDYLVAGEKPGSKLSQAEDLGVKVLNEDEFKSLLDK